MTRRIVVAGLVGIVVFGALWELFVRLFDVEPFILLPPSQIVGELAERPGFYLEAAAVTARHAAAGLVISLVVAVAASAPRWRRRGSSSRPPSRCCRRARRPVGRLLHVDRRVARAAAIRRSIFLVAFVTTPAFVFATVAGLRSADPAARELLASVDAGRWEVLWRLRLPSALPSILAAARYNVGLALAAAYYGEGGNLTTTGLGAAGRRAANQNAEVLWATILATVGARRRLPRRHLADRAGRPALARVPARPRVVRPHGVTGALGTLTTARSNGRRTFSRRAGELARQPPTGRPGALAHIRTLAQEHPMMRQHALVALAASRSSSLAACGDDDDAAPVAERHDHRATPATTAPGAGAVAAGAPFPEDRCAANRRPARSPTCPASTSPPRRRSSTSSSPSRPATSTSCASTSSCSRASRRPTTRSSPAATPSSRPAARSARSSTSPRPTTPTSSPSPSRAARRSTA